MSELELHARQIEDELKARGYPILGCQVLDGGAKIGVGLQLADGRRWAFRVPAENLQLDRVEGMVRAYL